MNSGFNPATDIAVFELNKLLCDIRLEKLAAEASRFESRRFVVQLRRDISRVPAGEFIEIKIRNLDGTWSNELRGRSVGIINGLSFDGEVRLSDDGSAVLRAERFNSHHYLFILP